MELGDVTVGGRRVSCGVRGVSGGTGERADFSSFCVQLLTGLGGGVRGGSAFISRTRSQTHKGSRAIQHYQSDKRSRGILVGKSPNRPADLAESADLRQRNRCFAGAKKR